MINKESFLKLELKDFEHTKKYAQLLNSSPDDLLFSTEKETVNDLINKSIKMGTLNLKYNDAHFDVGIRNISGNTFAYYPENGTVIIGSSSLDRLTK